MNAPLRQRVRMPELAVLPAAVHRQPLMIRFSHCDPAGIVYFAKYFDIANGVVEDFFPAALGLSYHDFIGARRIGLGFAHAECDFLKPGKMGDHLTVAVLIDAIGTASITFTLHGYRTTGGARDAEPTLSMRLVMVTTSLTEHRAIPVPDDLRAAVERYKETCR
ncbi:MAG: thioesterase family protein [Xanthobacteraceae bacterium]|nr:thioesterase family protein [Xanthobacteraceae bacterium]